MEALEVEKLFNRRNLIEDMAYNPALLPWDRVMSIYGEKNRNKYEIEREIALAQIEANKNKTTEDLIRERVSFKPRKRHPNLCTICNQPGHNKRKHNPK